MEHPYEYRIAVQFLTPDPTSGTPNFQEEHSRASLFRSLTEFADQLPQALATMPEGEGWEVNSHSLMFANSSIVVSMLLQRPKPQK
jgi:hypothetical protein